MERKIHTIDATGKVLGRLAAEIAVLLRGKHKPDFAPYKDIGDSVVVKNADKIKLTGRKLEKKTYFHHSGYMGSEREIPVKEVLQKKPTEVLRKAVLGMLPKNKLRARQIKRLKLR